ncbi:hypothetical protein PBI_COOPER_59 [Mycobacterium phage Cooper]|uniref:Uncharacterized protein n=1 Tax=Mycobacterium phage Cooper TaxID=373406 RepID=Q1A057_9CAUD|nr:gp59 [Mycobacterium phage Cooper]ABD58176.1 hypothetical protein PBI_COOPER_59 [Mycobacterium phage Cooper]
MSTPPVQMTPMEHYAEAERLLVEGVATVAKISSAAKLRESYRSQRSAPHLDTAVLQKLTNDQTRRMDELGKKAMGIWAQAQVHATLATLPFETVEVRAL